MTLLDEKLLKHEQSSRLRVLVTGAVQGVGFRPFVYRLATELGLTGWVSNTPEGVIAEIEGARRALDCFSARLRTEAPPRAVIHSVDSMLCEPAGYVLFEIRESVAAGEKTTVVIPDIATCPDCLADIFTPGNRRHLYAFTNCTNCGPRFSIVEAMPYDRLNTTMKNFQMCPDCLAEYNNPLDRRFHAQPNACPNCGPNMEFWDEDGLRIARGPEAFRAAANALRCGLIVGMKGIGGFQLLVDARREEAVLRLRRRKHRKAKPFAVMFPGISGVKNVCAVSELEEHLLLSPEAPIVLLQRFEIGYSSCSEDSYPTAGNIADAVAPENPYLGVMLPYSPIHHLLMHHLNFPVVATSGNLSDEPICTDETEAVERLANIADAYLVHDRPIARHADDSVIRVMGGRPMVVRRARGYAPLPVKLASSSPHLVAVGAHMKNTIAVSANHNAVISQHIGDLETVEAGAAFRQTVADFEMLYEISPRAIICDLHPDYASTTFAERHELPLLKVQHHYAHVLSCMADNQISAPVLGISWDGTGYGLDGTIWGGEFLSVDDKSFKRFAHLRPFSLPGGDAAVKRPARTALALLYDLLGPELLGRRDIGFLRNLPELEVKLIVSMLSKGLNCPITTSAGRLFDGVSALIGICAGVEYEGQAAMELEFALPGGGSISEAYPVALVASGSHSHSMVLDWRPMIEEILHDLAEGEDASTMSARFHNAMAQSIVMAAERAQINQVVLTGGCFQNRYLTEKAITLLQKAGFTPYWHRNVPPNDNGIALGQIMAALRAPGMEN